MKISCAKDRMHVTAMIYLISNFKIIEFVFRVDFASHMHLETTQSELQSHKLCFMKTAITFLIIVTYKKFLSFTILHFLVKTIMFVSKMLALTKSLAIMCQNLINLHVYWHCTRKDHKPWRLLSCAIGLRYTYIRNMEESFCFFDYAIWMPYRTKTNVLVAFVDEWQWLSALELVLLYFLGET